MGIRTVLLILDFSPELLALGAIGFAFVASILRARELALSAACLLLPLMPIDIIAKVTRSVLTDFLVSGVTATRFVVVVFGLVLSACALVLSSRRAEWLEGLDWSQFCAKYGRPHTLVMSLRVLSACWLLYALGLLVSFAWSA